MATNQETAVIKARMDRIPSALSPELVERISADRASGYVNPYRCNDDQVIRRIDRAADKGTLMRPAFMRDTEKILHLPAYTRYAGKTQVLPHRFWQGLFIRNCICLRPGQACHIPVDSVLPPV
jgi:hypothetical protein